MPFLRIYGSCPIKGSEPPASPEMHVGWVDEKEYKNLLMKKKFEERMHHC